MKKLWGAVLVAAALYLTVVAPAAAATPFIDMSQDKGSSASAEVWTCTEDVPDVGDSTCEFTGAFVFDGWSRYNGERFHGERLCVESGTSIHDASAHTYTDSFTSGCLEGADVTIDRLLASASAAGTVPTQSQSCVWDEVTNEQSCTDPVPAADVAVDLEWTGIPPVTKSTYRSSDQLGDCTSTYFSKGSSSEATVSGTLEGVAVSFDFASIGSGQSRFTVSCH